MRFKKETKKSICTVILWGQILIGFAPMITYAHPTPKPKTILISKDLAEIFQECDETESANSENFQHVFQASKTNQRIEKTRVLKACLDILPYIEEIAQEHQTESMQKILATLMQEIKNLGLETTRSPRPPNPYVTTNPLPTPETTFVFPRDVNIQRDLNVDGKTELNDVEIKGSVNIDDIRTDKITLTENNAPACLVYQGPNVEKARICSSGIPNQKGVSVSIDGGATKQWEVDNNGDVQISNNLLVAGTFQPNSLVVQSSAAVNGPTSLQATTINGQLNVNSSSYFNLGVPGIPAQILQVTKGSTSGPNQFNSIKAAIDSITDASTAKPYIVQVGAGYFIEDTITMKPYVGVAGDSSSATTVEVNAPSKDVLIGAPNSSISNVTLQGATDTGKAAIVYNGGGSFQISNCGFGNNNIIVNELATTGPTCQLTMRACVISGNASFERALNLEANSGIKGLMIVNNLFWTAANNPSLNEFAIFSGPNAEAFFITSRITSDTTLTGDGFVAQNGAFFSLETSEFGGFNRALYVPNVGTGPEIRVGSVSTSNDTIDLQIDNPTTIATIEGVFDKDKIIIDDSVTSLSLSTLNPSTGGSISVGPQFWGDQYKNITDTSPQIEFGSNLGVISGGILSDTGGLNVSISAGTGYLMRTDNTLKYITWNTVPTLTIPANSEGFISVNDSGIAQFATSPPNTTQAIEIGKVRTNATDIVYIQLIKQEADHSATQIDNTLREALGSIYSAGSLVSKNGNTQLNVTSGRYFYSTHEFTPSGGSPIAWSAFYRNGGAGGYTSFAQNNVDYQQYDNGIGALVPIPGGDFARHALYIVNDGANEKYLLQYAQITYPDKISAQNGVIPPKPGTWTGNITLIASIIVGNNGVIADKITEILDERPTLGFKASGVSVVTNHGSLSGLLNDDHPQYLLTNGGRVVTGNLNMGSNNITNAGQVNGVIVESHAPRHLPNGADPLTTATPVNIGTSNQLGIQNSFARSDHIHNHGNLAGGSLHADATTTIAGFMTAADKTKLDNINTGDFVQKSGDTMTGALNINTGVANALNINSGKLTVNGTSGNATIAGTATISSLSTGVVHSNASGILSSSLVVDADIDPASNVAVGAQAANDATDSNIANRIVKRDTSGNFTAGTITASLDGNATSADSTINFSGTLSGDVTGTQTSTVVSAVGGQSAANVATGTAAANNATDSNTASTIVKRDSSGNFVASTITANLNGNATTATSAGSFTGNLAGDVTGPQTATVVNSVGGKTAAQVSTSVDNTLAATNLNTANTIVKRDASGNFSADTITANLTGNATTATSAGSFTGNLAGDVTGPQNATVVSMVGGQTSANIASGAQAANNATSTNIGNRIVERDVSGNFAANTITANLSGNATTATSATNFSGNLAGDVTGPQGTTVVSTVGGQSATNIASATIAANAATSANIANTIVKRDTSGNFVANTITANLSGNATTATSATNFSGNLAGDVTGPQGTTVVSTVGGKTAAQISTSVDDTLAATNLNTASTIVKRDVLGNFIANTITANLAGSASNNVLKAGDTMTGSLVLSGAATDLTVGGSTNVQDIVVQTTSYFNQGVPGIPTQTLQVTKGTLSGPNQFNSIKSAVDSITDASQLKPYTVQVGPGVYVENTITLKPWVALRGANAATTFIVAADPTQTTIIGAPNAFLEGVSLEGAAGAGGKALSFEGGGGGSVFVVNECAFASNETQVYVESTQAPLANIVINNSPLVGTFQKGYVVDGDSTIPILCYISNTLWQVENAPSLQEMLRVTGPNAEVHVNASKFYSLSASPGNCFTVLNGAHFGLSGVDITGFNQAIYVPNTGAGPYIHTESIYIAQSTEDLRVDNPNSSLVIEGTLDWHKTILDPSVTISAEILDPEASGGVVILGPQLVGETPATVTNISPQISEGGSLGVIDGGLISRAGGFDIDIQAGTGYVSNPSLKYVTWAATTVTIPSDTVQFIYVDPNGTVQISTSSPLEDVDILLGKAQADSTGIVYVQEIQKDAHHTSSQLDRSWRRGLGSIYASGSQVSKNGTVQLDVSSGRYYFSTHEFTPSGGTAISWSAFSRNGGGGWNITTQNTVDFAQYDNGTGTLAAIPANNFARHSLYIVNDGAEETYLLQYGQTVYTTLINAQNGTIPPQPGNWGGNITLIASIIVENTAVTTDRIAEIRDERPTLAFKASGTSVVTIHGDLSGLLADDHPQYLLTDGGRTVTGNLDMGGNNITNVTLVDGVDVPAHASRHLPNGADPLTTAAPSSIGTSNQEGIANSFARSDHVHNHGDLAGGSLHAAATTVTAGFMSAADKITLDSINPANFVQKSGDTMTGALNINTGVANALNVNSGKLTVNGTSGNTTIGGTLGVTGTTTLSSLGTGIVHSDVSGVLTSSLIVNADVDPAAGIVDTKLATISTAGKVANSATTATTTNNPNTIVLRDGSGNFSAGTITANLTGTATNFSGSLSGDVTGTQGATSVALVGGKTAAQVSTSVDDTLAATNLNTVSTIVKRDGSGNFSAGTITADLTGTATNATNATTAVNFSGSLVGDVTGTQGSTVVGSVGGETAGDIATSVNDTQAATNINTPSTIVKRDGSGNFSAGTITASLNGNAATATTTTNFSGALSGDVTGTQGATVVSTVSGKTAAQVSTSVDDTLAATNLNTLSTIVKRDGSGNFSAGTITADLTGTATNATTAVNFSGSLVGDVIGTQGATVVDKVSGKDAAEVATSVDDTQAATNLNTPSTIVKRDGSGNFSAGTITANLTGTATNATTAVNFSGPLAGDVSGTQGATVVDSVGGKTAAQISTSVDDTLAATSLNTANTIVKRDGSGNFAAGNISGTFSGNLTGNVTGNLIGSASDNVLKAGDTMIGNLIMDNQQEIRLREQTVSGTNYLAMRAPTALGADYTLTWPINAGASNQVLSTDGTGNLSWVSPSSGALTTNVKAAAYMGTDATFPADTTITVPFDTEHFDPNNNFNTAAYTYTAPTTGYYNYCVQISANTINNFDYRVDVVINGTPTTGYGMRFRRADVPITLTNYILLTAGDILRIDFTGNGGDTVYANDTNFSIHLIST